MNTINHLADLRASLEKLTQCDLHPPLRRSESPEMAQLWWDTIQQCSPLARREHLRWLGRNDLFFLAVYMLNRKHFIRDERTAKWTFDRCKEVQDDPNGFADLWPRASFKSEVITFALTIQDLMNDPELTFGIFSHTRPMAADFVDVIKREFEGNELLKETYSDILWADPKRECVEASVRWSIHSITVKRKGNRKEGSIEAWGLVDGQPTGRRFTDILYDDVIARGNITELMILTTTRELQNSFLLTASDPPRRRYVATYQEIGDTTQYVIDNGIFNLRKRGPLDENGQVAFCSDAFFADLRKSITDNKVFALNILLDPSLAKTEHDIGFKEDWWEIYDKPPAKRMMNVYGLVDPAGDSTESNSQFACWIVGVCADHVARVLDLVLDKLDLEECWQTIFELQQKWECLKWGYEKYGMQRDIQHFKYRMKEVHYEFTIVPLGGIKMSKDQRIGELIPWFRNHRIQFPRTLVKTLKDGRELDLIKYFKEREYLLWPYNPRQRDGLDGLSRICDEKLAITYPRGYGSREGTQGSGFGGEATASGSFMSE